MCGSTVSGGLFGVGGTSISCCDTIQPPSLYPTGPCSIDGQTCDVGGEHGGMCTCEAATWYCHGGLFDMAVSLDLAMPRDLAVVDLLAHD
jgi:hypothetical protein